MKSLSHFEKVLNSSELILTEGSMFEKLRRSPNVKLDPRLAHAALIYNSGAKAVLEEAYCSYIDVAKKFDIPIIIFSATWRANAERIQTSSFTDKDLNGDNVKFLRELKKSYGSYGDKILIGGLMGCYGDAYIPSEALDVKRAEKFHEPQAKALAASGADFLFGSTLPSTEEALGMARAMSLTDRPYILSFVTRPNGVVLDNVPLSQCINRIDGQTKNLPLGYFVNCVHPSKFISAFSGQRDALWMKRVLGFQGNTSDKEPEELAKLKELETTTPQVLAKDMMKLQSLFGLKVLGGCCGTDSKHIQCLAESFCT